MTSVAEGESRQDDHFSFHSWFRTHARGSFMLVLYSYFPFAFPVKPNGVLHVLLTTSSGFKLSNVKSAKKDFLRSCKNNLSRLKYFNKACGI